MRNALNWFEIPVQDMNRAQAFYEGMTERPMRREAFGPPGEVMAVFAYDAGEAVGGALLLSAHARPSDQGTLVYLNADPRIDDWLARVASAGGQVVLPKTSLPGGMGYIAHIRDTEGNRVGIHAVA
jgi:predicted enzyme related to lactoylglutathione lyase